MLTIKGRIWVSIDLYQKIFISFFKSNFSWAFVLVSQLKLIKVWLAFSCVLLFLLGLLLDYDLNLWNLSVNNIIEWVLLVAVCLNRIKNENIFYPRIPFLASIAQGGCFIVCWKERIFIVGKDCSPASCMYSKSWWFERFQFVWQLCW